MHMAVTDLGRGSELVRSFRAAAGGRLSASPVHSTLLLAVVADPELGAPLEAAGPAARLQPLRLFTAVQYLLRTVVPEHPLAHYYPTLEGPYPPDAGLIDAFRDLVSSHAEELATLCCRPLRQDDPQAWAQVRPALSWVAARHPGRPVALVELGARAGLGLLLDRYRYDYGTALLGDGAVHLSCRALGATPQDLQHPLEVGSRVGIDRDPTHADDTDAVQWLLSGVWPEDVAGLDRLEAALAVLREVEVDLRTGDLFDLLPEVLASAPEDQLPVVFGSGVLSAASERDRARLPELLAASGRDLVWVMAEPADWSVPLVSSDPDTLADSETLADPEVGALTAVTLRAGAVEEVTHLARLDPRRAWLDWAPRPLTPR